MDAPSILFRLPPTGSPARRGFPWKLLLSALAIVVLGLVLAAEYILHNAEPILRQRIVETLAARFHAPVALDSLSLSLFRGVEVSGSGLRIGYRGDTLPGTAKPSAPPILAAPSMIVVRHFAFRTGLLGLLRESLLHQPTRVAFARVEGLTVHLPPPANHTGTADAERQPGNLAIIVEQFECRDVKLYIDSAQPDPGSETRPKPPLEFSIPTLDLQHVGPHGAMRYDAHILNSRPKGEIHVVGHFGPWGNGKFDNDLNAPSNSAARNNAPGQTPIDGVYTFDRADLGTIRGLGGTLSSTGRFTGTLDRLVVDGRTDTPNFALGIANHPTPLHTDFHAVVDGTTGDTSLQPVHAWLGGSLGSSPGSPLAGSAFTTTGKIVHGNGGHDIQLQVDVPHGRVQDFLRLAIRTSPPLMTGTLAMRAAVNIPPGNVPVAEKLTLTGTFTLTGVQFSNPSWQSRIAALSHRAQISDQLPGGLSAASSGPLPAAADPANIRSQISANLHLAGGVLAVSDLHASVPGVHALMNGVYSADGKLFEFKGHFRTDATASQMVGGWKGLLLSPFDHYLQRNGAGVELPVEISGTGGDLHLGLALDGTGDKPEALLADIQTKARAKRDVHDARGLLAEAVAEDTAASHAPTLEEAQRHHNNAVRLRARAQHEADASTNPNH